MITTCTNDRCFEFRGLSTDLDVNNFIEWHGIKIGNGSVYFCEDSSTVFMFDEESKIWREI